MQKVITRVRIKMAAQAPTMMPTRIVKLKKR